MAAKRPNRSQHNNMRTQEERLTLARRIRAVLHPTNGADPLTKAAVMLRFGISPPTMYKVLRELEEFERQ